MQGVDLGRASALRVLGLEKLAYGKADLLADLLAGGTAAVSGGALAHSDALKAEHAGRSYMHEFRQKKHDANPTTSSQVQQLLEARKLKNLSRDAFGYQLLGHGATGLHALGGLADSTILPNASEYAPEITPVAGVLGQLAGMSLLNRFAPNAGVGANAAAAGLGAIGGRLALRGLSNLGSED